MTTLALSLQLKSPAEPWFSGVTDEIESNCQPAFTPNQLHWRSIHPYIVDKQRKRRVNMNDSNMHAAVLLLRELSLKKTRQEAQHAGLSQRQRIYLTHYMAVARERHSI
jgi:hypothetical protein